MTLEATINPAKMEAFLHKVIGDTSGLTTTILAAMGDRLGLFKDLAANGPATSEELAARTGTVERYTREWLGGMATAGYVDYDPLTKRFTLPAEHAPILAQEGGPFFLGGTHHMLLGMIGPVNTVIEAFKKGGGVPQAAYDENLLAGMERSTGTAFENNLVPNWIPLMPEVQAKLERGALVADIGCGGGLALIKLAQAYPNSRFVGYDLFERVVERARENAEKAGVADRIRFEARDCSKGLPEQYDIIATFDVIHDSPDPIGILQTVRQAIKPDGIYICLEINCSDNLEDMAGPMGAILHGFSMFYCMTTSLAYGGAGLGTVGVPESKLSELTASTGFSSVKRVVFDHPFAAVYEVRP